MKKLIIFAFLCLLCAWAVWSWIDTPPTINNVSPTTDPQEKIIDPPSTPEIEEPADPVSATKGNQQPQLENSRLIEPTPKGSTRPWKPTDSKLDNPSLPRKQLEGKPSLLSQFSNIDDALQSIAVSDLGTKSGDYDTSNAITHVEGSDPAKNINGPLEARVYPNSKEFVVTTHFTAGWTKKSPPKLLHHSSCLTVDPGHGSEPKAYHYGTSEFQVYRSKVHKDEFLIVAEPWYFQVVTASDKPDLRLRANLYKRSEGGKSYPFVAQLKFLETTDIAHCDR